VVKTKTRLGSCEEVCEVFAIITIIREEVDQNCSLLQSEEVGHG